MISISYEWGGIEQHVKDLAEGFVQLGHKVTVVARDVELYKQEYGKICPVHILPIKNAIDLTTIKGLARLIKQNNVDIVHVHTSRDVWLGLFATKLAGKGKVVLTRHGPFRAKSDLIHTWLYNQLGAVFCVSEYIKREFLGPCPKMSTDHVHVFSAGVDVDKFNLEPNVTLKEQTGIFTIGFVGRVTKEKGVHDLIKALAILHEQNLNFKAEIVGGVNPDTPLYLEELKEIILQAGIRNKVNFYGFTNNVSEVMKTFDVLVLPSTIPEASPLVLREAMLCAKPVVGTNLGGQPELIQEGYNGYLVEPNSPKELAYALERLILNQENARQMGFNGREFALKRFDKKLMMEFLVEKFIKISK